MGATNTFENTIINHLLRNQAHTPPATIYLAALTAVTDEEAGSVTEVSGGAYARQAIALAAPTAGVATNSAQIDFPVATANWGVVTHFGIYDASTAGNLLIVSNALSPSKTINSGDQLSVAASAATFTVT